MTAQLEGPDPAYVESVEKVETFEKVETVETSEQRKMLRKPIYPRLLRLRHVHPNAWQRALFGEGAIGAALLLVAADVATAWTILVLPVAVAVVVKANDLVAGALVGPRPGNDRMGAHKATAPAQEGPALPEEGGTAGAKD